MSDLIARLDRAHRMSCSDPSDPDRKTLYGEAADALRGSATPPPLTPEDGASGLDLNAALARARGYLDAAEGALLDEAEGRLRDALAGLRAVSADMADLTERW